METGWIGQVLLSLSEFFPPIVEYRVPCLLAAFSLSQPFNPSACLGISSDVSLSFSPLSVGLKRVVKRTGTHGAPFLGKRKSVSAETRRRRRTVPGIFGITPPCEKMSGKRYFDDNDDTRQRPRNSSSLFVFPLNGPFSGKTVGRTTSQARNRFSRKRRTDHRFESGHVPLERESARLVSVREDADS